jgi:hypothetical protein
MSDLNVGQNVKTKVIIQVLEDAKVLLARESNDYSWSSFSDSARAIAEINDHIERIRKNDHSQNLSLSVLFAPTGPIQEVSLSSGWADEFLALAERFDRAEMK